MIVTGLVLLAIGTADLARQFLHGRALRIVLAAAAVAVIVLAAVTAPPADGPVPTLKGGRLIGPLERVIVFALTLTGVYSLLAAVLAAKGIVRFPEISRDGDTGNRAEYFLIGSLVSWVIALAAAFLVWWALSGVV